MLPLFFFLSIPSPSAFACGMVFSTSSVRPEVEISWEQALIHYADGIETLVIETGFIGEGEEFAWIVPLPAVPEVRESTSGLFPTLQVIFSLRVIHTVGYRFLLSAVVFGLVCSWVLRYYKILALIGGGLCVLVLLRMFVIGDEDRSEHPGTPKEGGAVVVHDRRVIGAHEIVTLSSADAGELLRWLESRGFAVPPGVGPVAADYVEEGWTFVAARLRSGGEAATSTTPVRTEPTAPRPLVFTFPCERPVYPLRLTRVGGGPSRIDLYVFGPGRAEVDGFEGVLCEVPEYSRPQEVALSSGRGLRVTHPELSRIVHGASVATRLTAHLEGTGQRKDAYIRWADFESRWPVRYSAWGAYRVGSNVALNFLFLAFTVILLVTRSARKESPRSKIWVGALPVLCFLVGGTVWYLLPRVEVREPSTVEPYILHRRVAEALAQDIGSHPDPERIDLPWVRDTLERFFRTQEALEINPYTGQPFREEDSPGNYTLHAGEEDRP